MSNKQEGENLHDYALERLPPGCTFCDQFGEVESKSRGASGLIFGNEFNRILYQDADNVIVPALGQFVEGWVLLIPRKHSLAIADLAIANNQKFFQLFKKTKSVIQDVYRSPLVAFEHGTGYTAPESGASIVHAHLHLVPTSIDFVSILKSRHEMIAFSDFEHLPKIAGDSSYILVNGSENSDWYISLVSSQNCLPSQYMRRLLADAVGMPNSWNWRNSLFRENILMTFERLKNRLC